ncbi:WPP motif-containing protein [Plasmodium yoelii yoelii]|uniref:WPP motif-containing protein n=1 Tax=Plasmodium yoelii yoelii TaxID=73239 RepID=A0AAE9WXY0_PLAYO|nr:WPP motif-containing protein [Plasmodium yoelii yoelii]
MISSLLRRPIIDIINKRSFTTTNNILNTYDRDNIEANKRGINTEQPDIYEKYEVLKEIKTKESLKKSLKKFREIVKRETSKKGYNSYYGWPPRNRIKVVDDEKVIRKKSVKMLSQNVMLKCYVKMLSQNVRLNSFVVIFRGYIMFALIMHVNKKSEFIIYLFFFHFFFLFPTKLITIKQ